MTSNDRHIMDMVLEAQHVKGIQLLHSLESRNHSKTATRVEAIATRLEAIAARVERACQGLRTPNGSCASESSAEESGDRLMTHVH